MKKTKKRNNIWILEKVWGGIGLILLLIICYPLIESSFFESNFLKVAAVALLIYIPTTPIYLITLFVFKLIKKFKKAKQK